MWTQRAASWPASQQALSETVCYMHASVASLRLISIRGAKRNKILVHIPSEISVTPYQFVVYRTCIKALPHSVVSHTDIHTCW